MTSKYNRENTIILTTKYFFIEQAEEQSIFLSKIKNFLVFFPKKDKGFHGIVGGGR